MTLDPDLAIERAAFEEGARVVVGLDEVGRGAWAGPVSVGAVALGPTTPDQPEGVRDSKRVAKTRRAGLVGAIDAWALASAVGHASHHECDVLGMRAAIALASSRALDALGVHADVAIVDGPVDLLDVDSLLLSHLVVEHSWRASPPSVVPVVKGDLRCASVAAASIVAKVERDRMMVDLAESFPAYEFDHNVGYPSPVHQMALRGYGLTSIHRASWSFVEGLPWLTGPPGRL
jgi:ribonuclease HII